MKKTYIARTLAIFLTASVILGGCGSVKGTASTASDTGAVETTVSQNASASGKAAAGNGSEASAANGDTQTAESSKGTSSGSAGESAAAADIFTERDLQQEADLTNAVTYTVADNQDITISAEGVYVITGTAKECSIIVDADSSEKVQLVLDGVNITNKDTPAIYVKSADKVFVTTTDSTNQLTVTGSFTEDGDTNTDAVIFSKDDLVLNGVGSLTISSTDNGISCKDDLKITGGTYTVTSTSDAFEANDSISICGGTININSQKDGLHCENDEDDTVGSVYISGGTINIDAAKNGIRATTTLTVDGGALDIDAAEGLESTQVEINDGTINIVAVDDGINAGQKSASYDIVLTINGGNTTINMGQGDTDAIDSNGDLYINGGTIDITAQFAFDFDGVGQMTGGNVTVNGQTVTQLTNSMMGGGGRGGVPQGGFGGEGGMGPGGEAGMGPGGNSGRAPGNSI